MRAYGFALAVDRRNKETPSFHIRWKPGLVSSYPTNRGTNVLIAQFGG